LKDRLDAAIEAYPETVAVLVRRHGIYGIFLYFRDLITLVWGNTWEQCKCVTECIDYLCSLAVEMKKLGLNPAA
jgi:methylthioribulose-1-phosphate dehydratase